MRVEINGAWREGRRAATDARRLPARRSRPDGHAPRVRERLLRQLQRAARRPDRPLLPDVRRAGRRALAHDRRGLAEPDGTLGRLQQAFNDHHGLQCGFCTPAMLLTAHEYLEAHPDGGTRRADPRGDQRRDLPLHGLPAHRRVDPRRSAGPRGMIIAEQDPNAAKVARDTAGDESAAPLARQEHQPRRGSALPARPGPLPRRHQAPRHAARGDARKPARAREDRLDPHGDGGAAPRRDRAS